MLKMTVKVKMDDKNGGVIYKDFPLDEVRFKKSAQQPKDEDDEEE
jgi:hypothetical protein